MSRFDEGVADRQYTQGASTSVSESAPELNDAGWTRACRVEDIPTGEAIRLPVLPPIAVFNVDGEFYATDDTCTHAESSLTEGYIDGDEVECIFHFAKFCIRTGAALSRPATEPLRTHEVRVLDGNVYVKIRKG